MTNFAFMKEKPEMQVPCPDAYYFAGEISCNAKYNGTFCPHLKDDNIECLVMP